MKKQTVSLTFHEVQNALASAKLALDISQMQIGSELEKHQMLHQAKVGLDEALRLWRVALADAMPQKMVANEDAGI